MSFQKEKWKKNSKYNAATLYSVKCVKSKLLPNTVLVIAANQSTVKLTTHSACYQTQVPMLQELLGARGMRVQRVHVRTDATGDEQHEGGRYDGTYCMYGDSDVNSRTCFLFCRSL